MTDPLYNIDAFRAFSARINEHSISFQKDGRKNGKITRPVRIAKGKIADVYLEAFPEGTNPVYRTNTIHDCSADKAFIRTIGTLVRFNDGQIETIWSGCDDMPYPYNVVAAALDDYIKNEVISGPYLIQVGHQVRFNPTSTCFLNPDDLTSSFTWDHFYGMVESKYVSNDTATKNSAVQADISVLERAFIEWTASAIEIVEDLINTGSLYRVENVGDILHRLKDYQEKYLSFNDPTAAKNYVWSLYHDGEPRSLFRLRNTSLGNLVTALSNGEDLEKAVRSYETMVAPANYRRTTAVITPRMVENAMKKLEESGLRDSVYRRMANDLDIPVTSRLFLDRPVYEAPDDIKDLLMASTSVKNRPGRKAKATAINAISIDDFAEAVVPNASKISVRVTGKHAPNFLTLTAPEYPDTPSLLAWDNGISWAYDGDVSDSITQRVKNKGGNIYCDFRVSLAWNGRDDLDIHCLPPDQDEIYYGNRRDVLDVDANASSIMDEPVENMAFTFGQTFRPGTYKFWVHQYNRRSGNNGFHIQVAVGAGTELQNYTYNHPLTSGKVDILTATVDKFGTVTYSVSDKLDSDGGAMSGENWGVRYGVFTPVKTMMVSPNYWGENPVGTKNWIFVLDGCKNPDPVRGFFNDQLRSDLSGHRKTFEVLGAKTMAQPTDDQMSGLGFSNIRPTNIEAKVTMQDGATKTYTVEF